MSQINLVIDDDIKYLLHWLDFHRHFFPKGDVWILTDTLSRSQQQFVERAVSRFVPHWTVHNNGEFPPKGSRSLHSSLFAFPGSTNSIFLAIQDKNRTFTPNNIADFLLNVRAVVPIGPALERTDDLTIVKFGNNQGEEGLPDETDAGVLKLIRDTAAKIRTECDYVYYLDAYLHSDWGDDRVILSEDINLLDQTDFNDTGHRIFPMDPYNAFLKDLLETKIADSIGRRIPAEKYHEHVSAEEHTRILNAMPYKKDESPEIRKFSEYMETRVSSILGRKVKIFNDDVWIRICRPSLISSCDYNPCHRDIYLDFYRNIVNIYVPIVGSNERSSLAMESGSHLWNERDIMATKGGAFFQTSGKKYSVDAIVQSRKRLDMVRPNPSLDEFILFSPYLIHGCSSNDNPDVTRASIEIRFILDTDESRKQEAEFRSFLTERVWR